MIWSHRTLAPNSYKSSIIVCIQFFCSESIKEAELSHVPSSQGDRRSGITHTYVLIGSNNFSTYFLRFYFLSVVPRRQPHEIALFIFPFPFDGCVYILYMYIFIYSHAIPFLYVIISFVRLFYYFFSSHFW